MEFDFDTTRTIVSLLYNGVLSRCQNIKWIVNHSGAALPALAGRVKDRVPGAMSNTNGKFNRTEGKTDKIPNGVFYELKRLYYECAHATYPMPMAALRAFAPPTQFLFGTDFPIEPTNPQWRTSRFGSPPPCSTRSTVATPSGSGRGSSRLRGIEVTDATDDASGARFGPNLLASCFTKVHRFFLGINEDTPAVSCPFANGNTFRNLEIAPTEAQDFHLR